MPTKNCVTCGKPFEAEDGRQKRCEPCKERFLAEASVTGVLEKHTGNGNGHAPIAEQVAPYVPSAVKGMWDKAADKAAARRDLSKLLEEVKLHYGTLEMVLNAAMLPLPATEKDVRIQFAKDLMSQSIERLEGLCQ